MRRPILFCLLTTLPLTALWACHATLSGPAICSQRITCEDDLRCVLGRCIKTRTMPVSKDAPELRFVALDSAWIDDDGVRPADQLPAALRLGKKGSRGQLLLRFDVKLPAERELQRAFLALQPLKECSLRPGRVALSVSQIQGHWRSADMSYVPSLSLPIEIGYVSATPAKALRLDVTEIVRGWQAKPGRFYGMVLEGEGSTASGACYSSGSHEGRGPELSVFLWPENRDAGVDGGRDGSTDDRPDASAEAGTDREPEDRSGRKTEGDD